nr:hypothetical protein [Planococcus beijingensis]
MGHCHNPELSVYFVDASEVKSPERPIALDMAEHTFYVNLQKWTVFLYTFLASEWLTGMETATPAGTARGEDGATG